MNLLKQQKKKRFTIGIVAPDDDIGLKDSWTTQIIRAIEKKTLQASADCRTHYSSEFPLPSMLFGSQVAEFIAGGIDALVVVSVYDYPNVASNILALVGREKIPIILISFDDLQLPVTNIYYDSRSAGLQAALHLIREGYSPLLFIAPNDTGWLEERISAAADAVRLAGLDPQTLHVFRHLENDIPKVSFHIDENGDIEPTGFLTYRDMNGYASAMAAFSAGLAFPSATGNAAPRWGIIAANDAFAYGAIRAAKDLGKIAGQDYGIVAFDDMPPSAELGLSSLRPPLDIIGEEAARRALSALKEHNPQQSIRIRSYLIGRQSTIDVSRQPAAERDTSPKAFGKVKTVA